MKDRYALFPMLDGWTTVFQVPGKRTTGTGAQTYAITGPGWTGTLPDGVKEYKSPTSIVWLLGRIYCTGTPEDYKAVHELQDQVKLVPLSAYGKDYTPPAGKVDPSIDMKTAVREQVNAMDAVEYFTLLCELMKTNPPYEADAPMVAKMAHDRHRARPGLRQEQIQPGLRQARAGGRVRPHHAALQVQRRRREEHQWLGLHDQDRHLRHQLHPARAGHRHRARRQPPAGRGLSDVAEIRGRLIGRDYTGTEKYVMTFKKGLTPPVDGFWSLTMYDANYFFVDNPLNRYSISARQHLKANADGSIDLFIQNEVARRGQGIQLAARAQGQIRPDDAALLAEREEPVDHQWIMGHTAREEGEAKCRGGLICVLHVTLRATRQGNEPAIP